MNVPPAKAGGFSDAPEGAQSAARADGCSKLRLMFTEALTGHSTASVSRKKETTFEGRRDRPRFNHYRWTLVRLKAAVLPIREGGL